VDPDSATLWIRIGNPDPGSGSRGKKIKKFHRKMHFLVIFKKNFYHLKGTYKIALTTFEKFVDELHRYF
jgi:hypothetical protein